MDVGCQTSAVQVGVKRAYIGKLEPAPKGSGAQAQQPSAVQKDAKRCLLDLLVPQISCSELEICRKPLHPHDLNSQRDHASLTDAPSADTDSNVHPEGKHDKIPLLSMLRGAESLYNISLEGRVVLVAGNNTRVAISDVSFHNSCLVVDQGAHVTLLDSSFMQDSNSKSISIVVQGEGSRITLNQCTIDGGHQAADISQGATLHGKKVTSTNTTLGFQVADRCSRLELHESVIRCQSPSSEHPSGAPAGAVMSCANGFPGATIRACSGSECYLHGCNISEGTVYASDAMIQLHNSRVANCLGGCCCLKSCVSAHFENCVLEESCNAGLAMSGGCQAFVVRNCSFLGHASAGVVASCSAEVKLHSCRSEGNALGYKTCLGANMEAESCKSLKDSIGFSADGTGSSLLLVSCIVDDCANVGVIVCNAEAELESCTVEGSHGMYTVGSKVAVRRCLFIGTQSNAVIKTGVAVMEGASFDAQETVCTGFAWMGVHVQGTGSTADLTRCELSESAGAVCSRSGAQCTLNECKLGGWMQSSHVVGRGSSLVMHRSILKVCRPAWDLGECLTAGSAAACAGAHMEIHDCELCSEGQHGVVGMDKGTTVLMTGCSVEGGHVSGVSALEGAVLDLNKVVSSACRGVNFNSASRGQLYLSECVAKEGQPYLESGGKIVCNACVPEDKSLCDE